MIFLIHNDYGSFLHHLCVTLQFSAQKLFLQKSTWFVLFLWLMIGKRVGLSYGYIMDIYMCVCVCAYGYILSNP